MSYQYHRPIYLRDTDAAGVVYFAHVLSMCHEAYEASLQESGINVASFLEKDAIALPITRATVDFRRPMRCGESYIIQVTPQALSESSFEIAYTLFRSDRPEKRSSQAATEHVAIDPNRQRCPLPSTIRQWIALLRAT